MSDKCFPQRFENKYQLDYLKYKSVVKSLLGYVKHDPYSENHPSAKYFVRSLYYDTYNYSAYFEKVSGDMNRIKLRIRSYWENQSDAEFINVEIKTRRGSLIRKFHTKSSLSNYFQFLKLNNWKDLPNPVLEEFQRLAVLNNLRPVVLVDYYREAFTSKSGEKIRITFDHNIKYTSSNILFPKDPVWNSKHSELVVLEIKSKESIPWWLQRIIQDHDLYSAPNSKYAQGIEETQNEIYRF